ncbi:MAG: putative Histidine kinase [Promethearchaeota archaeon]|nr:MAG: putative Histidine kinase [Candidatus Lokiarchaeota archaeon]
MIMSPNIDYKTLAKRVRAGFYKTRLDGTILDYNNALRQIFGFKPSKELRGTKSQKLWQNVEERNDYIQQLQEHEKVSNFVAHLKKVNGEKITLLLNSYLRTDDKDKDLSYSEGLAIEISDLFNKWTKIKKVKAKLKDSEKKFKTITEESSIGTFIIQDKRVVYINEQFKNLFGYSQEEFDNLKNKNFFRLVFHEDRNLLADQMSKHLTKSKDALSNFQIRAIHKSEEVIWLNIFVKRIEYEGKPSILISVFDITERKKLEKELKESAEKFRRIFESIPDAFLLVAPDTTIIDYSGEDDQFYVSPKNFIQKKITNFLPEDIAQLSITSIAQTLKTKKSITVEYSLKIKDKKKFFEARHLYFSEERVGIFIRDITEKERNKQLLKNTKDKFKSLYEEAPLGYQSLDSKGNILDVNKSWLEFFGFEKEEVIGSWFGNYLAEKDKPEFMQCFVKFKEDGEVHDVEFRVKKKNGDIATVKFEGKISYREDGAIKRTHCIMYDITQQRRLEKNLRESEKKYRTLFKEALNPIFIVDENGNYVDANKAAAEFLECKIDDIIGKNVFDYSPPGYEDKQRKEHSPFYSRRTLKTGYFVDDKVKTLILNVVPFQFKSKQFLYGIGQDITSRLKTEKKLRKSEEEYKEAYERANFYKDLFAHDINNILQNLHSSLELCKLYFESSELEKANELISLMREQISRAEKLVSNVRKLSKIEEEELTLFGVDLIEYLNQAIDLTRKKVSTRNLQITKKRFKDEIRVRGNELLLDVFENILDNAIKYNDSDTVKIQIYVDEILKNNKPFVRIEFIDNGIGIPNSKKKILFLPGFQKEKQGKGMGFGLSLVKKILRTYNGDIWVEDRIKGDFSRGTKFVIIIPIYNL